MAATGQKLSQIEEAVKLWEKGLKAATKAVKTDKATNNGRSISPGRARAERAKNNTAQGGGKFSLKIVDGEQVVWLENSVFTNKQLSDHKAIAEYIAEHIGEVYTIIESGQKVYIGDDLPGEYTHSGYTSYLQKYHGSELRAKNKAAPYLGELIETATNRRWEKTKHDNSKDATYGMYRYDNTFAFPIKDVNGNVTDVRAYDVELLIRNASDGKKYLYDIVNIKKNTAVQFDLKNREARLAAYKAAPGNGVSNDSIASDAPAVNKKYSLDMEQAAANEEAALKHFGRTYSWNETGYLTRSGKKLDFSGKHEGGPGGYRSVDHRDIADAMGEDYGDGSYSGSMVQFMREGNIRISPESGGINLSVMPTKAQLDALDDFISRNRGEVILDLDDESGNTVSSTEYPRGTRASKVINDIRGYFETGEYPQISETSRFRYSIEGTENIIDEVRAARQVENAAKAQLSYLRKQVAVTKDATADPKSVERIARKLITGYGVEMDADALAQQLQLVH